MKARKSKELRSINLVDFFLILKKNLKVLYILIAIATIISLLSLSINLSKYTNRTNIVGTISLKSPFENVKFIDLVTLEKLQVVQNSVSLISISEKIKIYYTVTREYHNVILSDLKNLIDQNFINASGQYYKLETMLLKNSNLSLKMIDVNDIEKSIDELEKFNTMINNFVKELLIKSLENEVESYKLVNQIDGLRLTDKQKINFDQRKLNIDMIAKQIKNQDLDNFNVFRLDIDITEKEFKNRSLISLIYLFFISIFFLIVIVRK